MRFFKRKAKESSDKRAGVPTWRVYFLQLLQACCCITHSRSITQPGAIYVTNSTRTSVAHDCTHAFASMHVRPHTPLTVIHERSHDCMHLHATFHASPRRPYHLIRLAATPARSDQHGLRQRNKGSQSSSFVSAHTAVPGGLWHCVAILMHALPHGLPSLQTAVAILRGTQALAVPSLWQSFLALMHALPAMQGSSREAVNRHCLMAYGCRGAHRMVCYPGSPCR